MVGIRKNLSLLLAPKSEFNAEIAETAERFISPAVSAIYALKNKWIYGTSAAVLVAGKC